MEIFPEKLVANFPEKIWNFPDSQHYAATNFNFDSAMQFDTIRPGESIQIAFSHH